MSVEAKGITILGAGSWGTALAILLARNGQSPVMWAKDSEHVALMTVARRNPRFLPDAEFPDGLSVTSQLSLALAGAADVVIAVPSHAFRQVLRSARPHLHARARIAWATKGFEPGEGRLLHQVLEDELGPHVPGAVISGPTFAREVAAGLPTAVTVASRNEQFSLDLSNRFHNGRFRVYRSQDVKGVQIGGAVKNVLAIAAGIADGLGFGANTRAALITRGLAELMRLGVALGGQRETFMGLAGLGDLVLTCTDDQSRNRRVGLGLAQGQPLAEVQRALGQVAEGVQTAAEVIRLAQRLEVDMPICEQVYQVIHEGVEPSAAVNTLLSRGAGREN